MGLVWNKDRPLVERRRVALKINNDDLLATAKWLETLSGNSKDRDTISKAKTDAMYFYRVYRNKK